MNINRKFKIFNINVGKCWYYHAFTEQNRLIGKNVFSESFCGKNKQHLILFFYKKMYFVQQSTFWALIELFILFLQFASFIEVAFQEIILNWNMDYFLFYKSVPVLMKTNSSKILLILHFSNFCHDLLTVSKLVKMR